MLKELLGEELYGQVAEKLGSREIAIVKGEGADGSWIPKSKFDELNTETKALKTQLKERDDQLKELSEASKGNEELTARITELENANKVAAEESAAALQQARTESALDFALLKANALNLKAVRPFIDVERLELLDDGTLKGLEDQLKSLTENDETKFLFAEPKGEEGEKGIYVGKRTAERGGSPSGKNPWTSDNLNLDEQTRIYRENPELAKKLMAEAGVTLPE